MNKESVNNVSIARIREMVGAMSIEEKRATAEALPLDILFEEVYGRVMELNEFKNAFNELAACAVDIKSF